MRHKASVITSKLDAEGAILNLNVMIVARKFLCDLCYKIRQELAAADQVTELGPLIKALLRIVQDVMSYPRPKEKEYLPFEKQREEAKRQAELLNNKPKDWL
jgi:hypothetical protein